MHNQLIILNLLATALSLGIYTGLAAIFYGKYQRNPTWNRIRNGAFLAWLLNQLLLHYIGRMGEITLADNLAPILTLTAAGTYLYAITSEKTARYLGLAVWCLLALVLSGQAYHAVIHDHIQASASLFPLTLLLSSTVMTISIHQIRTDAKQKAWLAKFNNPQASTH